MEYDDFITRMNRATEIISPPADVCEVIDVPDATLSLWAAESGAKAMMQAKRMLADTSPDAPPATEVVTACLVALARMAFACGVVFQAIRDEDTEMEEGGEDDDEG